MKLIIGEKPDVARSIIPVVGANIKQQGYYEGGGYYVSWCYGHLAGLCMPPDYGEMWQGNWAFEKLPMIPDSWRLKITNHGEQFAVLRKLMNDPAVDEIICATDADREGECIFRYVYQLSGCRKPVKRLWVSDLEASTISRGLSSLKDDREYDNLFGAGFSRAKADWLVGLNATRLFTVRCGGKVTIGRVQTPTLAMIVKRDYDIKHFVKEKYFTVEIDTGAFRAVSAEIKDENAADMLAVRASGTTAAVTDVSCERKKVNPPKLFDLTELQKAANRQFGYTADEVSEIAEELYIRKLSSYPRTDSMYISSDMEQTVTDVIADVHRVFPELGAPAGVPDVKRCINNGKVSGHHALIPKSGIAAEDLSGLTEAQSNVLKLICARLLLATGQPHIYDATKVTLTCADTEFSAVGKKVLQEGWKAAEKTVKKALANKNADSEHEDKTQELPSVEKGQVYHDIAAEKVLHWTSPPKLYTDDTLLTAMKYAGNDSYDEDTIPKGIGTPATRAETIKGLVSNGYIVRKGKQIVPTDRGIEVVKVAPSELVSPKLTAEWESQLQQIERGELEVGRFMAGIENYVRQLCSAYSEIDQNSPLREVRETVGKCPKCGANVIAFQKGYGCESGREKCGFGLAKKICGKTIPSAQVEKLLASGRTDIIEGFTGRNGGAFSAFFVLEENEIKLKLPEPSHEKVGICPRCGGSVIEQHMSFSCENESCDFTLWKNDKMKHITLTTENAAELLKGGTVRLNAVNKAGKGYYGSFKLSDNGKYANLEFVPDVENEPPVGKCPKCGADIKKSMYGFMCSGKCGMNVGKIFGRELTEQQLKTLLSGRSIAVTIKGKKTTVMPQVTQNEYNGKVYFQWGTK